MQFIDNISIWQLVEMGKKAPSFPVFSQTLRAGKLVVRIHKVKKFEHFTEILCPLNFKYRDWIKDCLWFEYGLKHLNGQIGPKHIYNPKTAVRVYGQH